MRSIWWRLPAFLTPLVLMGLPIAAGVEINQSDDFEKGPQGWRNGNASGLVMDTDGPDGVGDSYLLVSAGDFPRVPRLIIFNEDQWSGDYLAAGVTSISAMIRDEGINGEPLEMRLAFGNGLGGPFSGGTWYVSTDSVTIPAAPPLKGDYNRNRIVDAADYNNFRDSFGERGENLPADGNGDQVVNAPDYNVWRDPFGDLASPGPWTLVEFPIGEADLSTDGDESYADVMSDVLTLRLLHRKVLDNGEAYGLGDAAFASFGVDNITAHTIAGATAVPEPSTVFLVLLSIVCLVGCRTI